ncbi:4Fe-4S dicluster domain-containing protein [Sulfurospirillum barnesii]|uniref:Dissimilatory sulfite reductase (Desulfoviridin), alpha/beta subunit n=1 Tax=Sulfurospirillum barnesii (strain ATCC 700032 / DSM 10660 / SES-3) TaxID=760154 RepID=I3XV44_SULBS|nr:4Fe-4S binding protein [Sulfurospirillum barnesii]AFL67818.1 dissimilatory sulfite reductase (desulfoviridin), alpha/beta subunit [Sulfurospirillum barnesii SES-3]
MSHHTLKSGYKALVERLNRFPQGAPPSQTLYHILELLFSPKEAELVALLPIVPFGVDEAAKRWKMSRLEAQNILDELSSRAILLDIDKHGESIYVLPPPMAGFFEFSLMRVGGKIDQKILSELFHQYLNVEEDFIKDLFANGQTQLGRAFVNEQALSEENVLHVLDFERASHIIESSQYMGVGTCYCRHKKMHLGEACDAPLEICMTFGASAQSLTKYNYARRIDKIEGMELLYQAQEHNLVQFGENVQKGVNFICNCCGCCCEALIAARKFAFLNPVHTTNFLPVIDEEQCTGCGKCVEVCGVEAMSITSANNPHKPKQKKATLNSDRCLGCGVCVNVCKTKALSLKQLGKRILTPINGAHRAVMMAIERGKLQNFIFDNQALWSHRVMATILGVILKLPPLQQIMASEQIKSRYLGKLLEKY